MKSTLLLASLLLLGGSLFAQCKSDPYYNQCPNSPMWSGGHPQIDVAPLPDTQVGQGSTELPFFELTQTPEDPLWLKYPPNDPFWLQHPELARPEMPEQNTRPFVLTGIFIDPHDHPDNFFIVNYCPFPQPALPDVNCQAIIFWSPWIVGLQHARLIFEAHWADDGTDASHTVLLVGVGTK